MSSLDQFGAVIAAQQSQFGVESWGGIFDGVLERLAGEITSAGLPLNSSSPAYENARVVKAGAGTLFGFTVYNSSEDPQFIQWHDSQTIPADNSVPMGFISVPTVTSMGTAWVIPGRYFTRGIILVNSSTGPTLTIGSADCFFDAQYI